MFNAHSIKGKLNELHVLLDTHDPGMVLICESWLNETVSDAMIADTKRYKIIRRDRKHKQCGGVCAIVDRRFNVVELEINSNVEMLAFDIYFNVCNYRCVLCYRPPDYDSAAWLYLTCMLGCIDDMCIDNSNICIFGDFNLPYLSWDSLLPTGVHLRFHEALLDFVMHHGLCQCVTQPTRGNNILDIILVNDPLLINSCNVGLPFGTSDHDAVEFSLTLPDCTADEVDRDPEVNTFYSYNFKEADYVGLNAYLASVDWQLVFSNHDNDINKCMELFIDVLNAGMDMYVPIKQVFTSSNSRSSVKAFPLYIRQLFRKKTAAWRLYKRHKTDQLKAKYKTAEAKFNDAVALHISAKENELINKGNLGAFYKYVNNKLVTKSGVGPLKDSNGLLVFDDCDKAEVLSQFYNGVFTQDNDSLPDFPQRVGENIELHNVQFGADIVFKHLSKLKPNSSGGPDGLPALFLKNLAPSLSFPLSILFSSSFALGELPDVWKMATVTPIFKKGQSCDPGNYRPISLTCILCKVMESIIKDVVIKYLLDNKLITKQQHGFLARHSTCSQLLETVNDWSLALNLRNSVDTVYVDFKKAFDSVVHSKLIHKVKAYGISGNLLMWLTNFLSNRFQAVKIGSHVSAFIPVASGVPQGSVLGPLLFLICINDLVDLFGSNLCVKLFADDVKIYVSIGDVNNIDTLQTGLTALCAWASTWQLTISVGKCAVLHLGKNNLLHSYSINAVVLSSVTEIRDLGVMMDNKLSFSAHYSLIVCKAHQRACLILRCFESRDPVILFRAFTVFVRPLL